MSDPSEATHANPHPVSEHRTPHEIAKDEAGPIGQADGHNVVKAAPTERSPELKGAKRRRNAPNSKRWGKRE
jgi:hypothetical protein